MADAEDLSRAGSPVIDIDTDVRTTHITFVTDYGQQCHSPKILLVGGGGGTTFFGAAPLGGVDGGQKPLSCAQHTVPTAKTATSAGLRPHGWHRMALANELRDLRACPSEGFADLLLLVRRTSMSSHLFNMDAIE